MKKINLLGYLSMALVFIFISCNSEEGIVEINEKSSNQQTICGDEKVVDLIAGQHINVGTVTVSNDETNLYVTYNATGDWSITETHLYVGAEIDIPLNKPGNPIFGHFPLHGDSEDPFVIPLADLDDSFVVVAHAVVDRIVNGESVQNETAFGCGDKEFPGNRWGCYFDYEKQECEEEEECIDAKGFFKPTLAFCFANDGFTDWGWTNAIKYGVLDYLQIQTGANFQMPLYVNDNGDQCHVDDKIQVGYIELYVFRDENNNNLPTLSVKYVLTDSNYKLSEVNVFMDFDRYPTDSEGDFTTSTDYYNYRADGLDGNEYTLPNIVFDKYKLTHYSYLIPHAKICRNND